MISSFAYLAKTGKTSSIVHSHWAARTVSWHGLDEWSVRGKWRVTGQCLWVVHRSTDHADSQVLTTSYRGSTEQCCWHVPPQAVVSVSREDAICHRAAHASDVSHRQKFLSTGKQLRPQFGQRHQLMTHPVQHPHQCPLKHHMTAMSEQAAKYMA